MKVLYNRLLVLMLVLVASLLIIPLFTLPALSAPDSVMNVVGALGFVLHVCLIYLVCTMAVPKFCIKRS